MMNRPQIIEATQQMCNGYVDDGYAHVETILM